MPSTGGEQLYPEYGYQKATMFVASLCLTNLVLAAMFACIGIVSPSSEVTSSHDRP